MKSEQFNAHPVLELRVYFNFAPTFSTFELYFKKRFLPNADLNIYNFPHYESPHRLQEIIQN